MWKQYFMRAGSGVFLGRREDQAVLPLKDWLAPLSIRRFTPTAEEPMVGSWIYTNPWVGKRRMQLVEQKHLTLRPQIKRVGGQTTCFS